MRAILTASAQSSIVLEDEIKTLNLYLELEMMRFQNKFDFEIEYDENLEVEFIEIPTMLIQPFLENAILHGLATKSGSGHIHVTLEDVGDKILKCTVEDDGIGRNKASEVKKQKIYTYKSVGMDVTKTRLEILNLHLQRDITFQVEDLLDEDDVACGTKVTIFIPYEEV
jgi:LytS/YehU family sensor histidine kinase